MKSIKTKSLLVYNWKIQKNEAIKNNVVLDKLHTSLQINSQILIINLKILAKIYRILWKIKIKINLLQ